MGVLRETPESTLLLSDLSKQLRLSGFRRKNSDFDSSAERKRTVLS
jgi:hypothetical protein